MLSHETIIDEFIRTAAAPLRVSAPACLWTVDVAGQRLRVQAAGDDDVDPALVLEAAAAWADRILAGLPDVAADGVLLPALPTAVIVAATGPAAALLGGRDWAVVDVTGGSTAADTSGCHDPAALTTARSVWDARRGGAPLLDQVWACGPDDGASADADTLACVRVAAAW